MNFNLSPYCRNNLDCRDAINVERKKWCVGRNVFLEFCHALGILAVVDMILRFPI